MENTLPIHLQEVIFSSSNSDISKQISVLEKTGKIKKIAPRIYTPNFTDTPETIILRNLFTIIGKLYPNAVLSHRSALEFKPTAAKFIFLTYTYTKNIKLPGITLRFMQGHGAIIGDNLFSGELYVSQQARAFLENLQVSRRPGSESKTLSLPEIENYLEQIAREKGEESLNKLRDKAKHIAEQLNMQNEFDKLNKLISALLTTAPSKILSSPLARARAFGNPYDPKRLELFEILFVALSNQHFASFPESNNTIQAYRNFAFFEAYFSNYIEGTEFEINEAQKIINTDTPMPARHEDSHDILGTYKLVSNIVEMSILPSTPNELLDILQYRHQVLLSARISKNPGQFKDINNRAGNTDFVDYSLVKGTLIKGFDFYRVLTEPMAKAIFMMFLISEIHPFLDGNGRIARVMMNAELAAQKQSKIIIPTVYREDYILALRRLTRQKDPLPYIKMLKKAHEFSSTIVGDDISAMEKHLDLCNAFKEPDPARLKIILPPKETNN
ncbi:MAG: Fic family protein [Chitinophagales bacterium]|nr:Fic family protein [Chitinophagales bacterium]